MPLNVIESETQFLGLYKKLIINLIKKTVHNKTFYIFQNITNI